MSRVDLATSDSTYWGTTVKHFCHKSHDNFDKLPRGTPSNSLTYPVGRSFAGKSAPPSLQSITSYFKTTYDIHQSAGRRVAGSATRSPELAEMHRHNRCQPTAESSSPHRPTGEPVEAPISAKSIRPSATRSPAELQSNHL